MNGDSNIIVDFVQMLTCKSEQAVLLAIHNRLIQQGYKLIAKQKGLGFDIKYSIKSNKPIVAIFYMKDGTFEVHIRPLHVALYANRFSELSEHIRNCCIQGRDCVKCGYCDKAYRYEFKDVSYIKCQFICFNFRFTDIAENDIDSVLHVLDMELEHITKPLVK